MKVLQAPILGRMRKGHRPASGLFDELVVDNFAGGGGASMGIERALGRAVDVAVNHDPASVEMHTVNHPATRHYCENVWDVDPVEATGGRPVGLAWFSPDCKHFSRAKGGKPVEKKIRGLAWIVVKWAEAVRPRVIILENVREFETWGPLTPDNRPCPLRKGETFRRFVRELRKLGYEVEYRVLNAADYGAPTHRRRLFMIARRDGQPIVWPEPTHGPKGRLPYRTAAECIDWHEPCPSILLTRTEATDLRNRTGIRCNRPLAQKTRWRTCQGLLKFLLEHPDPFVAPGQYVNAGDFIVRVDHGGSHFRGQPLSQPLQAVTAKHGYGLVAPSLVGSGGAAYAAKPRSVKEPGNSVLPRDRRSVVTPYLVRIGQNGSSGKNVADVRTPLTTITSKKEHEQAVVFLTAFHHSKGSESRCHPPDRPINTVDTSNRYGLVAASVVKHYGGVVGHDVDRPLGTVTATDHHSLTAANLVRMNFGEKQWDGADEPLRTVTSQGNKFGLVCSHLVKYYGTGAIGQLADTPLHTTTSKCRFGLVEVGAASGFVLTDHELSRAKKLARLMRSEIGGAVDNHLIWVKPCDGGRAFPLLVVVIRNEPYIVTDVGLRMFKPRELARCQGFPDDYILTGSQSNQVARIGNSVPPQVVEAIIRANYCEGGVN